MEALPFDSKKIVLVDDDETFLELFKALFATDESHIETFTNAREALAFMGREPVDLVVTDVQMPGMDGIALFQQIQDHFTDVPVILITSYGSTQDAIKAVKSGAFHYFEKPLENQLTLFVTTLREAITKGELLRQTALLEREKSFLTDTKTPLIGSSPGIRRVLHQIKEVADLPVTVLIQGETGTGKELVAQAIYEQGNRNAFPFFAISCTELAPGLLESELFGHERGAFTGALTQKKGLFEMVHQGTILLDEISDASDALQAKLLRVLETRTVKRIGGLVNIPLEFRVLAATNRDLSKDAACGRFRQDLLYRLNAYIIEVPPLRDRQEDIPIIAEYYLNRFRTAFKKQINGFSENAMMTLRGYEWPGNVRELVNVIERAVITCKGAIITTDCLPFSAPDGARLSSLNLAEVERYCIQRALHHTRNNISQAAELLGIARKTLGIKVKKYGLAGSG